MIRLVVVEPTEPGQEVCRVVETAFLGDFRAFQRGGESEQEAEASHSLARAQP